MVQPHGKPADSSITKLRISVLKFRLTPASLLIVPALNKGNMLRGGFGNAFRRLCCIPQCRDPRTCPIAASCPYKLIFEPSPPAGAGRLSKNQDIPRPFIFRPPLLTQTHFEKGEPFEFELVLIGRAFEYLPYFVLSFRELAEAGLGLNRARCTLDRVWSAATGHCFSDASGSPRSEGGGTSPRLLDQGLSNLETLGKSEHSKQPSLDLVYSAEDQLFRSVKGLDSSEWMESRIKQLTAKNGVLTISFLTPTFIRADGLVIREPEFHHIFKRLRDRINALNTFLGDGPLEADFRGLGERSEKIRRVAGRFEWIDRARTSAKTGQRHELSGFVGEATYEGGLQEFLPWLVMGELVHVGKHAPWGNGRLELKEDASV